MAYFAEHLVPGLSLYSSWRKPEGKSEKILQPDAYFPRKRTLARRSMDVCDLGWTARTLSDHRGSASPGKKEDRGDL